MGAKATSEGALEALMASLDDTVVCHAFSDNLVSEGALYCRTGRGTYVNVGDALDAHGRGLWRLWAYAFALHVSVLLYFACAMYADDKL